MSVEQEDVVDAIGTDKSTGRVVLTISDHLPWGEPAHLDLLERKISVYLGFVLSGRLLEAYPAAQGRDVEISVLIKFPPSLEAEEFFSRAKELAQQHGLKFSYKVLASH